MPDAAQGGTLQLCLSSSAISTVSPRWGFTLTTSGSQMLSTQQYGQTSRCSPLLALPCSPSSGNCCLRAPTTMQKIAERCALLLLQALLHCVSAANSMSTIAASQLVFALQSLPQAEACLQEHQVGLPHGQRGAIWGWTLAHLV